MLGPTFDYTHRLIDPGLAETGSPPAPDRAEADGIDAPHVTGLLNTEGLIEPNTPSEPDAVVADLTRGALEFPASRDLRLQALA